jgi:hypothetical protein
LNSFTAPFSPAQEGVSPELDTVERGRGANAAITTTQGGALTRCQAFKHPLCPAKKI